MAVFSPRTWALNEPLTSSNMNTYISAYFTAMNKWAAKGDLLVASSSTVLAALTAGSDYTGLFARAGATTGLEYVPTTYYADSTIAYSEVINTDVETTIFTKAFTVPLYASAKNRLLVGRVCGSYANNSLSSKTLYLEANYGAMTALTTSYASTSYTTTHRPVFYDFWVQGNGATNVQIGQAVMHVALSAPLEDYTAFITGGIDSTAAVTLTITAKWSAAHATTSFRYYWSHIAVIAAS